MTADTGAPAKVWHVWIDQTGHINSYQPYIPTSPVRYCFVTECDQAGKPLEKDAKE